MRRYLVVANQTLMADTLLATIRKRLATGPARFYLVVPATHVRDQLMWTEGHDRAVAERRLHEGLVRFRSAGAHVDGEVGDANPVEAVRDVLLRHPRFDELILSTLPPGASRWLRQDLPHRIERAFALPVTHVRSPAPAAT
jgi:hypothetical protein